MGDNDHMPALGAVKIDSDACRVTVWAPNCSTVDLKILSESGDTLIPMKEEGRGYFSVTAPGLGAGSRYLFVLDGIRERPDPASRFQPDGVHGPSCVIEDDFRWTDQAWRGLALRDMIFYEIHVGTFTPEGTFDGAIGKLPYLKELGITCLEIMPVAQFPGSRNWGYDGACLYAVQNSYGGPDGLKRLVDACHGSGMAVCLDVVYNHLGPEGNYLHDFGPYFTPRYHTPWGDAVNYDGRESDHVRHFILANALGWVRDFHVDALRLDAVQAIYDFSAKHILLELQENVRESGRELGRRVHVIAESDLNDSRIIRPAERGGYGLSAQWSDDFHHALHAYLTGERIGYYGDFGELKDIAKAVSGGFVYDGAYSQFRKRRHGNRADDLPPEKLVVCIQNHDQVGNRMRGERISALLDFEKEKIAAALLLLSPYLPLIFMGQEYSETAPFQYFIDHSDPELIRLVRQGRTKELLDFGWEGIVPDPKSEKTFLDSTLTWDSPRGGSRHFMRRLYGDLIQLRKNCIGEFKTRDVSFSENERWISIAYGGGNKPGFFVAASLSGYHQPACLPCNCGEFHELLNTADLRYGGAGHKRAINEGNGISLSGPAAVAGEILP